MQTVGSDRYVELRDAIRALCAEFPAEYHRKIDEQRRKYLPRIASGELRLQSMRLRARKILSSAPNTRKDES